MDKLLKQNVKQKLKWMELILDSIFNLKLF